LEEQKAALAKVKAELEKLQSAPVRPYFKSLPKFGSLTFTRHRLTSYSPTTNSLNGTARSFRSVSVAGKGERKRLSAISQISKRTSYSRVSGPSILSECELIRLSVSIQPGAAEC
jgi:hypothetical protein